MTLHAETLKTARENKGLSQNEVANELGISRQAISKWENGRGYPDMDNLVLLSQMYEVSLDILLSNGNGPIKIEKQQNEEDQSILLLVLTAVAALIPFVSIFMPVYILRKNKKTNQYYKAIIVTNVVVILLGLFSAYNIIDAFFPIGTTTTEQIK